MEISGKEIAKRLGISTATVSLALNDRPGVSPQTKAAVLACREQMEKEAQREKKCGGRVLVLGKKENRDLRLALYECLNREGFILCLHEDEGSLEGAILLDEESVIPAEKMPVVCLNREKAVGNADVLQTDAYEAVQIAVRRLKERGCTEILYLTGGETDFAARERRQAFRQIRRREEAEGRWREVSPKASPAAYVKEAAEQKFGILYENERVCHAAAAGGWRGWVSEEICFGESPAAGICTVGTPAKEAAQQALKLLMRRMEGMERAGGCYILSASIMEPDEI